MDKPVARFAAEDRAAAEKDGAALPLFYKRPVAVSPARHFNLSYKDEGNFGFARDTNSVPLNSSEFSLAVRHFPIVFTLGSPAIPVTVVGIAKDRNLFVDAAGRWAEGVYIPAYVRRYPFIFIENSKKKEFTLGVDEASRALQDGMDNPLFRGGQPTELLKRSLAFCNDYQANVDATRKFCTALEEAELLGEKHAGITMTNGQNFRLTGFRVIDEAKFARLSAETFLRFRKRNWLSPIYLHLASIANWAVLVDRAAMENVAAKGG